MTRLYFALVLTAALGCAQVGQPFPDTVEGEPPAEDVSVAEADPGVEADPGPAAPDEGPVSMADAPDVPEEDATEDASPLDVPDVAVEDIGDEGEDTEPLDVEDAVEVVLEPCDDQNVCTTDFVDPASGECVNQYTYGICCTANPMCDDGDSCTTDLCSDGLCVHESACCSSDAECQDSDTECTLDRCVQGKCLHEATGAEGCCAPELLIETFDGELNLTILADQMGIGWQKTGLASKSPPSSLWFGSAVTENYDNGADKSSGTATFMPLQLPPGVTTILTWSMLMDVEPAINFDRVEVRLVSTAGELVIWDKTKTPWYGDWFDVSVDISGFGGQAVTLELSFDSIDGVQNTTRGVFFDDFEISSTCLAPACTTDLHCSDGLGATVDTCVEGTCVWTVSTNYCTDSIQCDDGEPCTWNICSGNQCIYQENTNCCLSDAECSDGDSCTDDDCVGVSTFQGGSCQAIFVPDCCVVDSQCNDFDPCTLDACPGVGEKCTHEPLAGCCSKNNDCDDGDVCTGDYCNFGSCVSEVVCCGSDAQCDDGDDLCTANTCVDGVCQAELIDQPGCCKVSVLFASFDAAAWTGFKPATDETPSDNVGWYSVTEPAWSSGGSLHYGGLGGATYDTGPLPNSATVTSEPLNLPITSVLRMSFWVWLDNEWSNPSLPGFLEWDELRLDLVDESGTQHELWTSASGEPEWWNVDEAGAIAGPKWTFVSMDLTAFKGQTVTLRYRFDTIDGEANAFLGAYLDDILVLSTCP